MIDLKDRRPNGRLFFVVPYMINNFSASTKFKKERE